MKYFNNCRTAEELKKEYRRLAMKLHPDIVGGDGEEFKVMQAEFEKLWERLKKCSSERQRRNLHKDLGHDHRNAERVYTYN